MPLSLAEFGALSGHLAELEDFLQEQRKHAKSVRHTADAAVLEEAMARVVSVHALAQLMLEPTEN